MLRFFSLSAATAALALSPAAMANDDLGDASIPAGSTPVKLVEFDGEWEVLKTSSRLRIWRTHLAYTLTVDENGNATECELDEGFRRTYVKNKLCAVLLKHHTFEPARDSSDEPIESSYTARLSYMDMRAKN